MTPNALADLNAHLPKGGGYQRGSPDGLELELRVPVNLSPPGDNLTFYALGSFYHGHFGPTSGSLYSAYTSKTTYRFSAKESATLMRMRPDTSRNPPITPYTTCKARPDDTMTFTAYPTGKR